MGHIQHHRLPSVCADAGEKGAAGLRQRTGKEAGAAEEPEGLPDLRKEVYCEEQERRILLLGLPVSSGPCAEGKIPRRDARQAEADQKPKGRRACGLPGYTDRLGDALAVHYRGCGGHQGQPGQNLGSLQHRETIPWRNLGQGAEAEERKWQKWKVIQHTGSTRFT